MPTPGNCPSCGDTFPGNSALCPRCLGETIEKPLIPVGLAASYKMLRLLGTGGMGAVYLAEENDTKRHVAIKIISRELGQDARGRNRFLREARTMATVQHPHIVQFHSVGEFSGQPYLVMQYVNGETLSDRMRRNGRLSVQESLRILRQTVEALAAAWEKKIVHRDIKPSNILLDQNGNVRVADFGLAKTFQIETDSTLTLSGAIIGSPHYISPEQAQGKEVDFRSDIYSLGIVLYEMLVGTRPFEDTTPLAIVLKHLNQPLPSPKDRRPDLPENIARLIQWMTLKDAAKRPSSYGDLLKRLDTALSEKKRNTKIYVASAAVAMVLLVTGPTIWFSWSKQKAVSLTQVAPTTIVQRSAVKSLVAVEINAIPWARFKLIPKDFEIPSVPEQDQITPSQLFLPEGEYTIELSNNSGPQLKQTIQIRNGEVNSFLFKMPMYDPKKAVAQIKALP